MAIHASEMGSSPKSPLFNKGNSTSKKRSWSPLIPIQESRKSAPEPMFRPTTSQPRAASRPLSTSPTLVDSQISPSPYSSQQDASASESKRQKQAGSYYVHHSPSTSQTCDTRLLFESTVVACSTLLAAVRILTGEGDIADVAVVERCRKTLPIYNSYCYGSFDIVATVQGLISDGDKDTWLRNQRVWEDCESLVIDEERDQQEEGKTYAEVLRRVYEFCGDSMAEDEGRVSDEDLKGKGSEIGKYGEENKLDWEKRHFSDDDLMGGEFESGELESWGRDDEEMHRGRSPTPR